MNVVLKASSENLNKRHVLPTPESPINSNLNSRSYVFLAIIFEILKLYKRMFPAVKIKTTGSRKE